MTESRKYCPSCKCNTAGMRAIAYNKNDLDIFEIPLKPEEGWMPSIFDGPSLKARGYVCTDCGLVLFYVNTDVINDRGEITHD